MPAATKGSARNKVVYTFAGPVVVPAMESKEPRATSPPGSTAEDRAARGATLEAEAVLARIATEMAGKKAPEEGTARAAILDADAERAAQEAIENETARTATLEAERVLARIAAEMAAESTENLKPAQDDHDDDAEVALQAEARARKAAEAQAARAAALEAETRARIELEIAARKAAEQEALQAAALQTEAVRARIAAEAAAEAQAARAAAVETEAQARIEAETLARIAAEDNAARAAVRALEAEDRAEVWADAEADARQVAEEHAARAATLEAEAVLARIAADVAAKKAPEGADAARDGPKTGEAATTETAAPPAPVGWTTVERPQVSAVARSPGGSMGPPGRAVFVPPGPGTQPSGPAPEPTGAQSPQAQHTSSVQDEEWVAVGDDGDLGGSWATADFKAQPADTVDVDDSNYYYVSSWAAKALTE